MKSPFLSGVLFAFYFLLVDAGKFYDYNDRSPTVVAESQEAAGAEKLLLMHWGARKKITRSIYKPSRFTGASSLPYFHMQQQRVGSEDDSSTTRHLHRENSANHHHYHHHHRHHKHHRHHHHRQHGFPMGSPDQHHQAHPTTVPSTTANPTTTERLIMHEPSKADAKLSHLQAVIVQLEQKLNELKREISGTKKPSATTVVDLARWDLTQEGIDEASSQKPTADLQAEHREDDLRVLGGHTFVDVDLRIG